MTTLLAVSVGAHIEGGVVRKAFVERKADAVCAVLSRHSTAKHQGVPMGFSEENKAFANVDHLQMTQTRVGQAEVE